jgi:hypothetical protein
MHYHPKLKPNNMKITAVIYSFLCFFIIHANAQTTIQGRVTDHQNEPLAFVNILINTDYQNGEISDIDGLFTFQNIRIGDKLNLSYIGYEPMIYAITEKDLTQEVRIKMTATSYRLEEVAIVAGENPAHRIIENAVKNRDENNPNKYPQYQCTTYNKMRFSNVVNFDKYQAEVMDKREDTLTEEQRNRDAGMRKNKNLSDNYYLGIMETITDKQFVYPNSHKEIVLHNKVSGLKSPQFAALATDAQPFSFYEPEIKILTVNYINPISRGSTKLYFFDWVDTIFNQQDTIFVIAFKPKKGRTFEGLKGVLYIHSNQYAIQNVIAEPADIVKMSLRIEQKYHFHQSAKKWFPEQLNMEWLMKEYPTPYVGIKIEGKSYIQTVDFQSDIKSQKFTRDKFEMADGVFDLSNDDWKQRRMDTLVTKEMESYVFIDSISKEFKLEQKMEIANAGTNGKFSLGIIDVELDKLLKFNEYENVRLGVGLRTNEKLIKKLSFGGYVGYGFRDKAFKYGGDIHLKLSKRHKMFVEGGYRNDLKSPGQLELPRWNSPFSATTEDLYQPIMDNLETFYGRFNSVVLKYGTFDLSYSHQNITPNSDYIFAYTNTDFEQFTFQELKTSIRYAYGEQTVSFMDVEFPELTKYPIFYANFTLGQWLDADIPYQKLVVGLEQNVSLHRFGSFEYHIEAGMINGDVPWTKLFGSRGLGIGFQPIIIANTFQTMQPNEFLSDQFVHLFFKYHLGTLTKAKEYFQPKLSIIHNQAWGNLANLQQHNQSFKTLEKGFFESGLEVNNLYRRNYLNIGYLGIGGGVYFRHGAYQFEELEGNLSYRFLFSFDF